MADPSIYEMDTREMLKLLRKDIQTDLSELKLLVTNHLFHRIQPWVLGTIALLTGLLGAAISLIAL